MKTFQILQVCDATLENVRRRAHYKVQYRRDIRLRAIALVAVIVGVSVWGSIRSSATWFLASACFDEDRYLPVIRTALREKYNDLLALGSYDEESRSELASCGRFRCFEWTRRPRWQGRAIDARNLPVHEQSFASFLRTTVGAQPLVRRWLIVDRNLNILYDKELDTFGFALMDFADWDKDGQIEVVLARSLSEEFPVVRLLPSGLELLAIVETQGPLLRDHYKLIIHSNPENYLFIDADKNLSGIAVNRSRLIWPGLAGMTRQVRDRVFEFANATLRQMLFYELRYPDIWLPSAWEALPLENFAALESFLDRPRSGLAERVEDVIKKINGR